MAKKYVPSGYQIINISLYDDDGDLQIQDSEDKKVLEKIINENQLFNKPMLLKLHDDANDYDLMGFVIVSGENSFSITNNSITYQLYYASNTWSITYIEEE